MPLGPAGRPAPLVVVRPIANAPRIVALDAAAAAAGLHKGLPLADARARVPCLHVEEEDRPADEAVMGALASWSCRWTPFVAVAGSCDLALDITGCAHLFGGEAAMLEEVLGRLQAMGFHAQGAVAPTLRAARALARWHPGARIAAGEERRATGPLPIAALELEEEARRRILGLGLSTLADLWAQPRAALAARFGAVLVARLDEMEGRAETPISPARPVPLHMAERRFAEPMADMETAQKVLCDLAGDLCRLLERQGLGARRLEASFFRSDGAVRHIEAATARPVRDAARMAGLFRERLAALADPLDPGFGFDVLRLSLLAGDPWEARQTAFERSEAEGDLSALVDTLSARLGAHRVMQFAAGDTHLPEGAAHTRAAIREEAGGAFAAVSSAPVRPGIETPWPAHLPAALPATRPLTLFERPEPVEALAEVPDGPPLRFRWRRALHEVARAEGPERIAPEWWLSAEALTRDYFRVEDKEGRRFWLFREGTYGRETARPRWFLHGLFA